MAAFAAPLIGSAIGGIAGLFNKRPPALNANQTTDLNSLLTNLLPTATGAPKIDPTQQALMYNQINANQVGAGNNATNSLVSRGLGHSGILGTALMQVANQGQQNKNQADLGLQQQAVQQKQLSIQDIIQMLGVNTTPGQSNAGAFSAGLAGPLAYSMQNMMNNRNPGFFNSNPNGNLPFAPSSTVNSSVYGAIS
jgi:hypothetical protein